MRRGGSTDRGAWRGPPTPPICRPHRTLRAVGTHCRLGADHQIWVHFGVWKMSQWLWGQRRAETCQREGSSDQIGVGLLSTLPQITGGKGSEAPCGPDRYPHHSDPDVLSVAHLFHTPVQFPADARAVRGLGRDQGCIQAAAGWLRDSPRGNLIEEAPPKPGAPGGSRPHQASNSFTSLGPF